MNYFDNEQERNLSNSTGDSGSLSVSGDAYDPIEDAIVFLLIDTSMSMDGVNIESARGGAREFARSAIEKGYYVGIISFDTSATYMADPTDDVRVIHEKIALLRPNGTTNMAHAFDMVYRCFDDIRPDIATVVVVTDGLPDSVKDALDGAEKLKDAGVTIITIGTDNADEEFLKKIASARELGSLVASSDLKQTLSKASDQLLLPEGE
jgi:Mg-chelatase subunit ChlD